MSRLRLILLGVLAILAVGAVSSAPALADPTPVETTACTSETADSTTFCLKTANGLFEQLVNGEWAFESNIKTGTASTLNVTGGPDIQCTSAHNTFTLDTTAAETLGLNVLNVLISFTNCEVINSAETKANCVVKVPIETKAEGEIKVDEDDVIFKPIAPSTVFAEITIKSAVGKTCIFAKEKQKVTGEQLCELVLPEAEEDKAIHALVCLEAGSTLKYAEKEAKFTLEEEVFLTKGGEWSFTTS